MASYGLSTSESPVGGSSSDDEGWQDDVAEDLDIFVRLSKAGHFTRAEEFFHAFLETHASDFAVAAQYAENLIEQGSFALAEDFLFARLLNDLKAQDEESKDEESEYEDGSGSGNGEEGVYVQEERDDVHEGREDRYKRREDRYQRRTERDERRRIVRLLLSNACIYTKSEERRATSTAYRCLREVGNVLIAEDMSPLEVSDRSHRLISNSLV